MRLVDQLTEASTDNLRRLVRRVLSRRVTRRDLKPENMQRDQLVDEARWEVDPYCDRGMY